MEILNNQFYINIKDGKVKLSFKKPVDLPQFLQIMQTAILNALQQMVESSTNKEKAKEELYDLYNIAASNTLSYFAPEIEMRPNLTTDALLHAENEVLNEAWQKKRKRKQ